MAEWARLSGGEVDLLPICLDHYKSQNENTTITLGYEIAHSASILLQLEEYAGAQQIIKRARELVDTSLGRFALPDVLRVEAVLQAVAGDTEMAEQTCVLGLQTAHQFGAMTQALKLLLALKQWLPSVAPKFEAQLQDVLPTFAHQESALARNALS